MKFTDKNGVGRYGRYRLEPVAGTAYLDDATAAKQSANFLFDELTARVGREEIGFRLNVQVAEPGDVVDDATEDWPASRKVVELGRIALRSTVADDAEEQTANHFRPDTESRWD